MNLQVGVQGFTAASESLLLQWDTLTALNVLWVV